MTAITRDLRERERERQGEREGESAQTATGNKCDGNHRQIVT